MLTLEELGIVSENAHITALSTPYDNPLIAFQKFLAKAAAQGACLRTIIYSDTLPQYFQGIEAAKKAGCDVKVLFDHTQAEGKFEKEQIAALDAAGFKDGTDFLIGTSPDHREILHQKQTTIWAPGLTPTTLLGSWNFSYSASKEVNNFVLIESAALAAQQKKLFDALWAFIQANEQEYQTQ